MLGVSLSLSAAESYLNEDLSIAAVNSPVQVVFSGPEAAISALMARLSLAGVAYVQLSSVHGFHSKMQDAVIPAFKAELEKVSYQKPSYRFVSNLTGELAGAEVCSPLYWARHLREPVKFSSGLSRIIGDVKDGIFIEIGPGGTLKGLLKQQPGYGPASVAIGLLPSRHKTGDDQGHLSSGIGKIWSNGIPVNWDAYYRGEVRNKIPLPTYCFEPSRYPAEVDPFSGDLLLGLGIMSRSSTDEELKDWVYYPLWKQSVLSPRSEQPEKRVYLFFSPEKSITERLSTGLLRPGDELLEVVIGKEYKKHSAGRYELNPSAEDFKDLFGDLNSAGVLI
ncbi:acyltransferase domain-containing protein, partial [Mucilaginibacter angelicae]